MNPREITTQISEAADSLNLKKWDYGASFSNDYSVQVDKGEAKQLKALMIVKKDSGEKHIKYLSVLIDE